MPDQPDTLHEARQRAVRAIEELEQAEAIITRLEQAEPPTRTHLRVIKGGGLGALAGWAWHKAAYNPAVTSAALAALSIVLATPFIVDEERQDVPSVAIPPLPSMNPPGFPPTRDNSPPTSGTEPPPQVGGQPPTPSPAPEVGPADTAPTAAQPVALDQEPIGGGESPQGAPANEPPEQSPPSQPADSPEQPAEQPRQEPPPEPQQQTQRYCLDVLPLPPDADLAKCAADVTGIVEELD